MGPAVAVQEVIESHLPSWERALYLAETYLEQAGWLFRGVGRQQLIDEMLPVFYKKPTPYSSEEPEDYSGPHDLALLYMVFAIGALVDLREDPANPEAEHYHQIARAAICLQPVLEKPSLMTIQTLHLLSIYNAMSSNEVGNQETSMETTWSLITLATHLSQTVCHHIYSLLISTSDSDTFLDWSPWVTYCLALGKADRFVQIAIARDGDCLPRWCRDAEYYSGTFLLPMLGR